MAAAAAAVKPRATASSVLFERLSDKTQKACRLMRGVNLWLSRSSDSLHMGVDAEKKQVDWQFIGKGLRVRLTISFLGQNDTAIKTITTEFYLFCREQSFSAPRNIEMSSNATWASLPKLVISGHAYPIKDSSEFPQRKRSVEFAWNKILDGIADAKLVCNDGGELGIDRAHSSAMVGLLQRMFASGMEESKTGIVKVDISLPVAVAFVRFLYGVGCKRGPPASALDPRLLNPRTIDNHQRMCGISLEHLFGALSFSHYMQSEEALAYFVELAVARVKEAPMQFLLTGNTIESGLLVSAARETLDSMSDRDLLLQFDRLETGSESLTLSTRRDIKEDTGKAPIGNVAALGGSASSASLPKAVPENDAKRKYEYELLDSLDEEERNQSQLRKHKKPKLSKSS
jgi:hypothetical protein